jgi:hypothetical protein
MRALGPEPTLYPMSNGIRWFLVVGIEVGFWASIAAFLLLRYWFDNKGASRYAIIAAVVDTAALLVLGVIDFLSSGHWSFYQNVIIGIIAYSLIWGRGDLRRLDAWAARKMPGWKARLSRQN